MKTSPSFQLASNALLPGVTLIEASAGTGKTFTIAGLFLRLILERKFSVSEILVVTYTEAATEELRGRIRQMLADAARAFAGRASDDPFLQSLIERLRSESADILARLRQALNNFDEAPIFTIHGFCQRQLRDRAFESGALFDTTLLTDPSALLQETADDYWRRRFYEAEPLLVQVALKNKLSPDRLLSELELHCRHSELRVLSPVTGQEVAELAGALRRSFEAAREAWRVDAVAIREIFAQAESWGMKSYAKPEEVAEALAGLERCFSDAATPESFACLKFFSADSIAKGTAKRSKNPPFHRFFDLCEEIARHERDFVVGVRLDFLKFARAELPRRKQRLKAQTYDDLLTSLHAALTSPGGGRLAEDVRAKYKAALIDEFQDTDPVQYQIFRRLFAVSEGGDGTSSDSIAPMLHRTNAPLLFLIGDPKQAIYGFRGADFFTYLDAARRADRRFTLDANWRSESGLVRAVNTLFQRSVAPFVFEDIQFHPVVAQGEADLDPLREDGKQTEPFHFWFFPSRADAREITREKAEEILPRAVASEIVRLLKGNVTIGDRPLGPQDIAVLVLKHDQAALLQEALRAVNVPSVLHTEASVFASAEALELSHVLASVAEPASEPLLRAALATSLLGINGEELETLSHNEVRWQDHLERFRHYAELWDKRGFTPMMRALLHQEQVRQRLLVFPDGDRRLTNVLHLAEALHQAALERKSGPVALQRWLADRIACEDKAADEHQLRLERDDFAVRIVTIHKSKGLEYPVVFCPFAWKSSDLEWGGEEQVFFHERPDGGDTQYFCDLGSAELDHHRALAFREKLAENVRLLYVALTRARNRCYMVWGKFRNAGTSAPAWLFHPAGDLQINIQARMNSHFELLDDNMMRSHLAQLVSASAAGGAGPGIRLSDLPEATVERYQAPASGSDEPSPRRFTGVIEREWRITSFSGLAAHRHVEEADYDPVEGPPPPEEEPGLGIFAFPRGTKAGTCLHKILETIDFTAADETEWERIAHVQLEAHGFHAKEFSAAVVDCIRSVLRVPLDPARPEFTLSRIRASERMNELEFGFPLARVLPGALKQLFMGTTEEGRFARLSFDPLRGHLQGFIDLVFEFEGRFHVIDWKSNWLGNRIEDYHQEAMRREMSERLYPLQYHLYALALHQYLALRVPGYDYERHFGGVYYLFVRGVDPIRPQFGVFRDRPPAQLMDNLRHRLIARTGHT